MSFPRYPQYKDSRVEWLGDVPVHWPLSYLKHIVSLNPAKSNFEGNLEESYSFVPMEKLKTGRIMLDEVRSAKEVLGGYTYFEDGDVLQAKVTPCFENKNIALAEGLTNGVGFGSTEINVLRSAKQLNPKFLYYRVQEDGYMSVCTSSMIGAGGLKRVPPEVINTFKIALPPLKEQTKIATFLDHETAKIDALIQEQQRLIELLKEKRQAVISHAVTKGLDPSVPMKNWGVEWLGEVPEHWEAGALRWFAAIQGGIAKGKEYGERETLTLPYLRVANVQDGYVDLSEVKDINVLASEVSRYSLKVGDVLMNEGGDNDKLGRGTVWSCEIDPCLHQNHVFAIRPEPLLLPEWLATYTQSYPARAYFFVNSKQSTNLASISASNIMGLSLPVPPVEEQTLILSQLSAEVSKYNQLIDASNETVSLLQERRSALISAAVTGKIDVRNWKPPADESAFDEEVRKAGMEVAV